MIKCLNITLWSAGHDHTDQLNLKAVLFSNKLIIIIV